MERNRAREGKRDWLALFTSFRHSPKEGWTSVPSPDGDFAGEKAEFPNGAAELGDIVERRCWTSVKPTGRRPTTRYNHAATVIGRKVIVVGGECDGSRLNDVQVLHLGKLAWTELGLQQAASSPELQLPPCSGHSLISWGKTVLLVGGDMDSAHDTVPVWSFDLETERWTKIQAKGELPASRTGQTVTRAGSILIMFGGEDCKGRKLNDIHVLDLRSLIWLPLNTTGKGPSPRSRHVAAMHNDRYLVFGGASKTKVLNDLYALDFQKMEWSRLKPAGFLPPPRAGSAAVLVGDKWYICGGADQHGNNICETVTLDISNLLWTNVVKVVQGSVVGTHGLSLVMVQKKERVFLVAFGGSGGGTSGTNEVQVLYISPQTKSSPKHIMAQTSAKEQVVRYTGFNAETTPKSSSGQGPIVYRSPSPDSSIPGLVPLRRLHQQVSLEQQTQVSSEQTGEDSHYRVECNSDAATSNTAEGIIKPEASESCGRMEGGSQPLEASLQSSVSSAERRASSGGYESECDSYSDRPKTIVELKEECAKKLAEVMDRSAAEVEAMAKEKEEMVTRLNELTQTHQATEEKLAAALAELEGLRIKLDASEVTQEHANNFSNILQAENLRLEHDRAETQKELQSARDVIKSERTRAFHLQTELYNLKQKRHM